jgi:hypothetical protein
MEYNVIGLLKKDYWVGIIDRMVIVVVVLAKNFILIIPIRLRI